MRRHSDDNGPMRIPDSLLAELYNDHIDSLGVPPWDGYSWPPRQSEVIRGFLYWRDPDLLSRLTEDAKEIESWEAPKKPVQAIELWRFLKIILS